MSISCPELARHSGHQIATMLISCRNVQTERLGLGNRAVLNAGPYAQGKTLRREACQIDLLIRARESIYLVELKCRRSVGVEVIDDVKRKVERLKLPKGQSFRTVLVHTGKLDTSIEESDYFDVIINADEWLS